MTALRIAGTIGESIVDGPGIRYVVFTQGCPHRCPGCHNPDTHDFAGGTEYTTDEIIEALLRNPLTDGITFSGGEPFSQPEDCAVIAKAAKAHGLNVWAYSGWTYEKLMEMAEDDENIRALLTVTDILVDGPFILAQRDLQIRFRGSRNQRALDVSGYPGSKEIVPMNW